MWDVEEGWSREYWEIIDVNESTGRMNTRGLRLVALHSTHPACGTSPHGKFHMNGCPRSLWWTPWTGIIWLSLSIEHWAGEECCHMFSCHCCMLIRKGGLLLILIRPLLSFTRRHLHGREQGNPFHPSPGSRTWYRYRCRSASFKLHAKNSSFRPMRKLRPKCEWQWSLALMPGLFSLGLSSLSF